MYFRQGPLDALMRIRDWQDILKDVIDRDVDPDDWRAISGDRSSGLGEDMYLGHPKAGMYVLKTYAKNPFEVKGVGSHVARNIDDEIGSFLPDRERDPAGRFAVRSPPKDEDDARSKAEQVEEIVRTHSDAPTKPTDLFDDVMDALESPAFGPMKYDQYDRPDDLDSLAERFEEAEDLLSAELDELIETDEVDRGFM